MSSRWWRAYDEAVDDPKLVLLSDRAHRGWFNLMCVASANGGALPELKIIAVKLRLTPSKAQAVLDELTAAGLIDVSETGMRPHNWDARQFKSDVSTARVQRFRERHDTVSRNVSSPTTRNVSETPPESDTESEAETEKKERARGALVASDWPADYREQFWAKFPNKVGRADALAKLDRVKKRGSVTFSTVMAGLERYVRKTDDRAWCNPATWIHQERWTDQPAQVQRGPPRGHGNAFAAMLVEDMRNGDGRHEPDDDDTAPTLDLDPIR